MTVSVAAPVIRVAGAASPWVAGLLTGPVRPAGALHAGRDAVHLDLGGACVGVLSARAALLPCGVRTTVPGLPPLVDGAVALVGDGAVRLPGLQVDVVGRVRTVLDRLPDEDLRRARHRAGPVDSPHVAGVRDALPAPPLRALATGDPAAVPHLVGRGPGLTPLGDDVLCGWLVTAGATGDPALPAVAGAVLGLAFRRTTLLSATLLACAARGETLPQVRDLLRSLAGPQPAPVGAALDRLTGVGGTSGAGLALGCLTALAGEAAG